MIELLRAFWRRPEDDDDGELLFWTLSKDGRHKESFFLPINQLADASDESLKKLISPTHDDPYHVYFGTGLRRAGLTIHQQGGKKDVIAVGGVSLDLDFFNPLAHKARNLPKNFEEAHAIIEHLSDPSAVVFSGNGAQAHWFFRKPLILDSLTRQQQVGKEFAAFQKPIIERAAEKFGWQVDATYTIQRVWRAPGFINQKTGKPTSLEYCDGDVRYEPDELGFAVPKRRGEYRRSIAPKTSLRSLAGAAPTLHNIIRSSLARVAPQQRWHKAAQAVIAGVSMAPEGQRDETLQGICSTIAWIPECREADPQELAEFLRPSLQVWADEGDSDKTIDEELAKAADKIQRSQQDYFDKQEESKPLFSHMASIIGADPKETSSKVILKHSILKLGRSHYAYDYVEGDYSRALIASDVSAFARDAWEGGPEELSIRFFDQNGAIKTKKVDRLVDDYATVINHVTLDATIEKSNYDQKERKFRLAVARRRKLEPHRDPQVEQWLHLLGGAHHDKLLDSIVGFSMLDRESAAVMLTGPKGCGKSLFASAAARLYTTGSPCKLEKAVSRFNLDIARCPIIFLDEASATEIREIKDISSALRELIGSVRRMLEPKGFEQVEYVGAVRVIIAANNTKFLSSLCRDSSSKEDFEALGERVLIIKVGDEAAEYLNTLKRKDPDTLIRWFDNDIVTQHFLWLIANRKVDRSSRFLVAGNPAGFLQFAASDAAIYEWLIHAAFRPKELYQRYFGMHKVPPLRVGDGRFLISADCIVDNWSVFLPKDTKRPSRSAVHNALKRHSPNKEVRTKSPNGRARVRDMDIKFLASFANEHEICDPDELAAAVNTKVLEDKTIPSVEEILTSLVGTEQPLSDPSYTN